METPTRIAFVSPCGWGNLGDAAIIDALIQGLRRRIPAAEIVGFTMNPEDTSRRHGVEAHTCLGYSVPGYLVRPAAVSPPTDAGDPSPAPGAWSFVRRALGRAPALGPAARWMKRARAERGSYLRTRARLQGFRYVVIAGGGQLDDLWGGPFGHPYALWRWSRLARQVGARWLILSVGTGTLGPVASRAFVTRALAAAAYRSFRDDGSRELLAQPALTRDDPTVPDLAYSLGIPSDLATAGSGRERLVFGLGPMAYGDPRSWPIKRPDVYQRHVTATAELATRLLSGGHEVVLFATSGADQRTVAEVQARIQAAGTPASLTHLRAPAIDSVDGLLRVLAGIDLVVASRLHAVLLSHVMARPVLAVSPERKVDALMSGMDQARYCLSLTKFDPMVGWSRLMELGERRAVVSAEIAERVAGYRRQVEAQYDRVFGPAPGGG